LLSFGDILVQSELSAWDKTLSEYRSETAVGSATKLAVVCIICFFVLHKNIVDLKAHNKSCCIKTLCAFLIVLYV